MFPSTQSILASGLALLSLGAQANAYGCYSGGITFSDIGRQDSIETWIKAGADKLTLGQTYQPHERKTFCKIFFNSHYNRIDHVDFTMQNRLDVSTGLDPFVAYDAFRFETIACPHGSEQDHDKFFYIIDPNEGGC